MRLLNHLKFSRNCLLLLGCCQISFAGGLYLTEISTNDTALAGAGWAARAQDPSTVISNPAGMTELEGRQFQTMLQPLYLDSEFDDGNTTADASGWAPSASAFYTHQINDQWTAGIGLAGYVGLALDYDDNWSGRYYVQEVTLQSVGLQPALAYRINDQWSIGAGVSVLYGIFDLKMAVNKLTPGDGRLDYEDETVSFQGNLGVLFKLNDQTRFGLQYFTESDQDFEDTPSLRSGLSPISELELNMTLPQSVIFSAFHQFNERLAIMGNVGWQEWSKFGEVGISTANGFATEANRNYEDTWHIATGIQYQLSEQWLLNTGVAYDTEMVKEENMTADLPTGDSIRWGIGGRYQYSEAIQLQVGYEVIYYGDLDMSLEGNGGIFDQGDVSGTYPDTAIHFFSLGLNWKF